MSASLSRRALFSLATSGSLDGAAGADVERDAPPYGPPTDLAYLALARCAADAMRRPAEARGA